MFEKLRNLLIKVTEPKPQAWQEGNEAYYSGSNESSCPYKSGPARQQWLNGYMGKK